MNSHIPGLATALALTPEGACTVPMECVLLSGNGKLIVTGNLGRQARDSAHVALTLARSRSRRLGIPPADFLRTDVHFHVPGSPARKDGVSAGLAMFMALVSAMTRKPLDPTTAFAGELSLSGKLYPAGGMPEKFTAAGMAGVLHLLIPKEDLDEIKNAPQKGGIPKLVSIEHVDEALTFVFGKPKSVRTIRK